MKKLGMIWALVVALVLAGCAPADSEQTATAAIEAPEFTVTVAGEAAVGLLVDGLGELYLAANPDVAVVTVSANSGVGLAQCKTGNADIAMLTRELKETERTTYADIETVLLCKFALAIVVSPDSPVSDLTIEQITQIYTGEITDWSELSATEGRINRYMLSSASPVGQSFEQLFLGKDENGNQIVLDETMATNVYTNDYMSSALIEDSFGIGFMPLTMAISYNANIVSVDGVEATVDNVTSGVYPYYIDYTLATVGEVSAQAAAFIAYCAQEEAAVFMSDNGYIVP